MEVHWYMPSGGHIANPCFLVGTDRNFSLFVSKIIETPCWRFQGYRDTSLSDVSQEIAAAVVMVTSFVRYSESRFLVGKSRPLPLQREIPSR